MKNGFTLIELLAVIVILAIVALIAVPIVLGIIKDARDQASQRTAELISKELQLAYTEYVWHHEVSPIPTSSCEFINSYFKMNEVKSVNCENNVTTIVLDNNQEYVATYSNGTFVITGAPSNINIVLDTR